MIRSGEIYRGSVQTLLTVRMDDAPVAGATPDGRARFGDMPPAPQIGCVLLCAQNDAQRTLAVPTALCRSPLATDAPLSLHLTLEHAGDPLNSFAFAPAPAYAQGASLYRHLGYDSPRRRCAIGPGLPKVTPANGTARYPRSKGPSGATHSYTPQ